MKRPQRVYKTSGGNILPMTASQEKEAGDRLFRAVLQWRGISSNGVKTCDRCHFSSKSRKNFVIHHRHYETFDCEKPEDVCLLCKNCHSDLHQRWDRMDLTEADIPFVHPGLASELKEKKEPFSAKDGDVLCPKCGSPMIKRYGKHGAFWGCSAYPACNGTRKSSYLPPEPKGESLDAMYREFPLPLTSENRLNRRVKYGHLFPMWLATFRNPDGTEFTQRDSYADEEDAMRNFQAQKEFLGWKAELVNVAIIPDCVLKASA